MSFFARKTHFFDKNGNIYPCQPLFTFNIKELFSYGNFLLKFRKIHLRKVKEMVKPPLEHLQFSQKWAMMICLTIVWHFPFSILTFSEQRETPL